MLLFFMKLQLRAVKFLTKNLAFLKRSVFFNIVYVNIALSYSAWVSVCVKKASHFKELMYYLQQLKDGNDNRLKATFCFVTIFTYV